MNRSNTPNEDRQNDLSTDELEYARFVAAIEEGEQAIALGKVRPADEVIAEIRAKYALPFSAAESNDG